MMRKALTLTLTVGLAVVALIVSVNLIAAADSVGTGLNYQGYLEDGSGTFDGKARWLEVNVRGSGQAYETITPGTELTPVRHALALPGLRTEQDDISPNVIGGYNGNSVTSGKFGSTIGGGGESDALYSITGWIIAQKLNETRTIHHQITKLKVKGRFQNAQQVQANRSRSCGGRVARIGGRGAGRDGL